jgi:hypothetical protein
MAISFIDKPGLLEHLGASGYRVEQVGNVWVGYQINPQTGLDVISSGSDAIADAINALIAAYVPLNYIKAQKRQDVRETALSLINTKIRPIADYDTFLWLRDLWLSIAPAARAPNTNFAKLIEIATQAIAFYNEISAATDWQTLVAKNYTNTTLWNIS